MRAWPKVRRRIVGETNRFALEHRLRHVGAVWRQTARVPQVVQRARRVVEIRRAPAGVLSRLHLESVSLVDRHVVDVRADSSAAGLGHPVLPEVAVEREARVAQRALVDRVGLAPALVPRHPRAARELAAHHAGVRGLVGGGPDVDGPLLGLGQPEPVERRREHALPRVHAVLALALGPGILLARQLVRVGGARRASRDAADAALPHVGLRRSSSRPHSGYRASPGPGHYVPSGSVPSGGGLRLCPLRCPLAPALPGSSLVARVLFGSGCGLCSAPIPSLRLQFGLRLRVVQRSYLLAPASDRSAAS